VKPAALSDEPASPLTKWVRIRLWVTVFLLFSLFAFIARRAYELQVGEGDHYKKLAERQHLRTVEVPAPRGAIYDATGDELAVTAQVDSVFANPREVKNVGQTSRALAAILEVEVKTLESKLAAPRSFIWLKRQVSADKAERIRKLKLAGVSVTKEPKRYYALGTLAGPVLGFVSIDNEGLAGVERKLDAALTGRRAQLAAVRDASGGFVMAEADVGAQTGSSVTLTLDRSIQFIAERTLAESIKTHEAKAGVALVMRVGTGEILAMANYPSLDPNHPSAAKDARNRAVMDAYEIGSVMKIFTVAAALENGAVSPSTVIDVEGGRYKIGGKVIVDTNEDHDLTIGGVLKRSSNVGAYKIARKLGKEALHRGLLRYGFGRQTGIELPAERNGLINPPASWGETGLAAVSYGYNLTVTPIQVIASFAAVGSSGVYYPPRIVRQIRDASGMVTFELEPEGRRIMSEKVAGQLMPMLESVFEKGEKTGGTASSLKLNGFRAAGKSGTAHKVDAAGGYSPHAYMSSFIGLVPAEKPLIAILVIIDEPRGNEHYGALVAGPAFVQIAEETLKYLGVPLIPAAKPEPEPVVAPKKPTAVEMPPEEIAGAPLRSDRNRKFVPDFRGMGIAQVLDVAADHGLTVHVEGSGRAVSQTPAPGFNKDPGELRVVFGTKP
jgi:cell division protein FtsI (penicillin-binding protein 3)